MIVKNITDDDISKYYKQYMAIEVSDYDRDWTESKTLNELYEKYILSNASSVLLYGDGVVSGFCDILLLIDFIRIKKKIDDDVVIYFECDECEIQCELDALSSYDNIKVKVGRDNGDGEKHFDDVLGVSLSSSNQHGIEIKRFEGIFSDENTDEEREAENQN